MFVERRVTPSVTATRFLPPATVPLNLGEAELQTIAEGLARTAHWWPLEDRPTRGGRDLMVVSEDFEAWVMAWPPGGAIELHDHGDAVGAVVVAKGELVVTSVDGVGGAMETDAEVLGPGSSMSFGSGHVHDMRNMAANPAISVHVYAPRLTSATFYEIVEGRLEALRTTRYRLGEIIASL